ncbi:DeoR family transcriptional regulator [Luteococcus japonicus]|uniref:DeoR family transcriptional regulator n=2 Tax=Luteococcus japonicus TaxID=33984 RepID=A0A3N1ZYK7_9ACTN|nr:DeoR family transcriptional regulator [Luteococcus japonicus]
MTSDAMPSAKRSDRMVAILAALAEHGSLQLAELSTLLDVSPATIRRDVASLAAQGLLSRTHGGVRSLGAAHELPVSLRDGWHRASKRAIAQLVAGLVPPGRHAIALTGGTTTTEVLRALRQREDLTIITNSVGLALEAAGQGQSRVLIAGGVLRPNSLELVGNLAEATFRQINVGTAIVGSDGVSVSGGLTTHDEIEANTNHTMIERAQCVIAVADGSKVGQVTLARLARLDEIDVLVTDSTADSAELERIRQHGIQVHVVTIDAPV